MEMHVYLRVIDCLVAEHVLGWSKITRQPDYNLCYMSLNPDYPNAFPCHIVPNYSVNFNDAWSVLERVRKNNSCEALVDSRGNKWFCNFYNHAKEEYHCSYGSTPMEAICLAALKMKNIDVQTILDRVKD